MFMALGALCTHIPHKPKPKEVQIEEGRCPETDERRGCFPDPCTDIMRVIFSYLQNIFKNTPWASLVVQWLRIQLSMQGTWV